MIGHEVVSTGWLAAIGLIGLAGLAVTLWAIIDAASTPSTDFTAAGHSKGTWIVLMAILYCVTAIIGVVLALFYLLSIRPNVRAAADRHRTVGPPPIRADRSSGTGESE
jgi:TRAP-type C4-dicarboxylate transport system permease small subunit